MSPARWRCRQFFYYEFSDTNAGAHAHVRTRVRAYETLRMLEGAARTVGGEGGGERGEFLHIGFHGLRFSPISRGLSIASLVPRYVGIGELYLSVKTSLRNRTSAVPIGG